MYLRNIGIHLPVYTMSQTIELTYVRAGFRNDAKVTGH
jgi:hypothetical protein